MKIKYRSGYAEGGFLDDGASVDAVSGNEVPTGSLQSEVRDDIPTQLSEGEFVIPADVVRFIGLEKLMKIRATAKAGLSAMEEEGQIGGQPATAELDEEGEMDALIDGLDGEDFDGAMQNFAEGGSVSKMPSYKKYMGREFGKTQLIEFRTYINAAGDKVVIKFVDGQPLQPIPEGYSPYVEGETPEETPVEGGETEEGTSGGGSTMHKNDANNPWKGITAPGDTDAIKEHHQIRSDRITRDRRKSLTTIASDEGATQEDIKYMRSLLTPDAIQILETRGSNKDSWEWSMLQNKTPAQLMEWAQATADTKRRTAGLPDPGYSGKPEGNLGEVGEWFSEAFSGGGDILDIIKRVGVIALGAGIGIPALVMDRLYDKAGGDKSVVDAAISEQGATAENSSGSGTTELEDALKLQRDLTVKLQDAEDRGDSITSDMLNQKKIADARVLELQGSVETAVKDTEVAQTGWDAETVNLLSSQADLDAANLKWSGKIDQSNAIQKATIEEHTKALAKQKDTAETKYKKISEALKGSEGKTDAISKALQAAKDKAAAEITDLSTQLFDSGEALAAQTEASDIAAAEWAGKEEQSAAIQKATIEEHTKVLAKQKDAAEVQYKQISEALKGSEGKTDAISKALQVAKDQAAKDISDLSTKLYDSGEALSTQKDAWDTSEADWLGKEDKSNAKYEATVLANAEALATQKGAWDADSEAYTTKLADAEITRGNVADNHALQLSVQKEDAETKYNEISAALKGSEGKTDAITVALQAAKDKAAEDISDLSTQLLESSTQLTTQKSAWDTSEADWDVKQGDWDTANKEWSGKVDQSKAIQDALQEDLANTKQALADSQQAVQEKSSALANKDAELQAALSALPNTPPPGTGNTSPTPPVTPPNTPPPGTGGGHPGANPPVTVAPPNTPPPGTGGGGGGGGGGYTGGWGNPGYSQKKARETGNGYLNKGGLISKEDTPTIKKMRSDNTTGLAAKKKSKERAKAKKGALAAKRT